MAEVTAPPPSAAQSAAFDLYLSLIRELKHRLFAITDLLESNIPLPSIVVQESCYLQLRLCCELLAIGCLVQHGDIEATKKKDIQKAYEPGKIIAHLSELHSNFFPVPIVFVRGEVLRINDVTAEWRANCLTKEELVSTWNKLGSHLHKGSLKGLLTDRPTVQKSYPEVGRLVFRFRSLLEQHSIANFEDTTRYVVLANISNREAPVSGAISSVTKRAPKVDSHRNKEGEK